MRELWHSKAPDDEKLEEIIKFLYQNIAKRQTRVFRALSHSADPRRPIRTTLGRTAFVHLRKRARGSGTTPGAPPDAPPDAPPQPAAHAPVVAASPDGPAPDAAAPAPGPQAVVPCAGINRQYASEFSLIAAVGRAPQAHQMLFKSGRVIVVGKFARVVRLCQRSPLLSPQAADPGARSMQFSISSQFNFSTDEVPVGLVGWRLEGIRGMRVGSS